MARTRAFALALAAATSTGPRRTGASPLLRPRGVADGGAWIPDTCREATIALPIHGVARVWIEFARGRQVPPVLVARHSSSQAFPDHRTPISTLVVEKVEMNATGVAVIYRTEVRTDVPPFAELRLPLEGPKRAKYVSVSLTAGTTESVGL